MARRMGAKTLLAELLERCTLVGEGRGTALMVGRRLALRIRAFRAARASLRMESAERGFLALGFRGLYGRWLNFEPTVRGLPVLRAFAVAFLAGLLRDAGELRLEDGRLGLVGIGLGSGSVVARNDRSIVRIYDYVG